MSASPFLLLRQTRAVSTSAAAVAVLGAVAAASALGAIGADSRWLAALGAEIVDRGGIPDGVPFAAAPSDGWNNVLVAAELAFHGLNALGERGLLAAQLVAVAVAFAILALDARREGATDAGTAVVLLLVVVGAFTSLVVVRVQLFSLALFPAVLAHLHAESRRPSRRVWLLVPLFALWGNLHGAVLVGLAVAAAYLLVERARVDPWTAIGVGVASVLALLATPALLGTLAYYRGVLENEAARQGVGLWESLDPRAPLDLLLIGAALVLIAFALRGKPRAWELVAFAGLALVTARTARSGVWLLFALAVPAARGLRLNDVTRPLVAAALAVALAAVALVGLIRGPIDTGASRETVRAAVETADGTPILAEGALAEQIVLAGGRIWIGNPIDAFAQSDQRVYVDWLEGDPGGRAALERAPRVVVVAPGSDAERLVRTAWGGRELTRDANAVVYVRDG